MNNLLFKAITIIFVLFQPVATNAYTYSYAPIYSYPTVYTSSYRHVNQGHRNFVPYNHYYHSQYYYPSQYHYYYYPYSSNKYRYNDRYNDRYNAQPYFNHHFNNRYFFNGSRNVHDGGYRGGGFHGHGGGTDKASSNNDK